MKKLSTYFIATIFFVAMYPKECDWPNPDERKQNASIVQPTIDNNVMDITVKLS